MLNGNILSNYTQSMDCIWKVYVYYVNILLSKFACYYYYYLEFKWILWYFKEKILIEQYRMLVDLYSV